MRLYDKKIDETIITILHNEIEGKLTYGKLEERLKTRLKTFSSETYSGRLKRLSESSNNQSRYAIQPVLNKKDNGRGRQVFYSLTKNARIRCDLGLPILKSETQKEKTYRILLHYMAFEISFPLENHNKKLKDENEFYNFLQHLQIPKNELQYAGKLRAKGALYTVTSWKHPQSEITFYHKDYLDNSDKHGDYEYSYRLPGISISEFVLGKRSGRIYEEFSLQKDEIIECFNLLEEKYLIKKLLSLPLLNLNEERYIIGDNSLKEFLQDCWNLHSHVHRYLEDMWKFKQKPSDEERIWYEHLWGKSLARKWFLSCKIIRRENKKNKKKLPKERVQEKLEIRKKFELIKKEYKKIIKDYSYFIVPLLNVVYPQFLRES